MRESPQKNLPPRNTPDLFCRRFTRQNHRCAAWAVFFFFTNKILCSCSIFQNLVFSCWLYNFKVLFLCLKEVGRSVRTAPGFLHTVPWILHKPSERDTVPWPHTFCGRAGQRRCKTGAGTAFGVNGDSHTWAEFLYLFLRLNNSETFVELVGARPLHLLSQTVLPLKSPTGAFIAALRFANAVQPQTLLMVRTWWCEQQRRVVLT